MFGLGKNKEYVEVKGKVMRIGVVSASENIQACVILLEGDIHSYISRLCGAGEDVVALTQPGDLVEFKTEKGYLDLVPKSFVNKTLAEKGYKPQPWK
jgi:predicted RNA-binding protein with PUA domain